MRRQNDDLLKTAERRRFVLKRREAGDDYRTIARKATAEFGADRLPAGWDERYAAKDVKRELEKAREECRETAESVREMELRRLDRMLTGLWEGATDGDTDAIHATLRLMKRRASLLGLDAPERFEQAVSFMESEDYQEAVGAIMEALRPFPEARAAAAEALADEEEETP